MKSNEKSPLSGQTSATEIDSLSYEDALEQLEQVINKLELGDQTLDQSLELYERGQALAKRCAHLLDQAELKIKQLSGEDLVDFKPEG